MKLLTPAEVVQAIQDGEKVEFRYPNNDTWHELKVWENVSLGKLLNSAWQFRLAQEMVVVGDVSFPKAESEPLKDDDEYWVADPTCICYALSGWWAGDKLDKCALSRGLLHKSKENAIAHAKALIKLSGGQIE